MVNLILTRSDSKTCVLVRPSLVSGGTGNVDALSLCVFNQL